MASCVGMSNHHSYVFIHTKNGSTWYRPTVLSSIREEVLHPGASLEYEEDLSSQVSSCYSSVEELYALSDSDDDVVEDSCVEHKCDGLDHHTTENKVEDELLLANRACKGSPKSVRPILAKTHLGDVNVRGGEFHTNTHDLDGSFQDAVSCDDDEEEKDSGEWGWWDTEEDAAATPEFNLTELSFEYAGARLTKVPSERSIEDNAVADTKTSAQISLVSKVRKFCSAKGVEPLRGHLRGGTGPIVMLFAIVVLLHRLVPVNSTVGKACSQVLRTLLRHLVPGLKAGEI